MVHRVITAVALIGILNLAAFSQSDSATAWQQDVAKPSAGLGFPPGIGQAILGEMLLDELPSTPAVLRLEEVRIEPGVQLASHLTTGPELLVAETGQVVIADDFGVEAVVSADTPVSLHSDATYQLRNEDNTSATLIRVALFSEGAPPSGSPTTPIPSSSTREPCANCLDLEITDLPDVPATLSVARLTLEPGADSGQKTFSGLVTLLVESGDLSVVSPSGIEGQLAAGRSLTIPAGASTRVRNTGDDPVMALLAAIHPAGQPLVVPFESALVSTPLAGQQEESPPPTPTQTANITPAGSVLGNHDTWRTETALLTLDGGTSRSVMNGETILELELTYTNIGEEQVDFVVRPVFIRVYDDEGEEWGNMGTGTLFNRQAPEDQRVILAPEETEVIEMEFLGPVLNGDRKVTIEIEEFGDVRNAKWEGVVGG